MKRSPLSRKTPLQRGGSQLRRSRLNPVSAKRRARADERATVTAEALARDGGRCRLLDMISDHRCHGPITPHEIRKQSHDTAGRYDVENVVALCAWANSWVENEPLLAHRLGLVIRDEDL